MKILVVGGGSIGERHLRVLTNMGSINSISLCEPDKLKRERLVSLYKLEYVFADIGEFDLGKFDAAVIATPAHTHIPLALELVRAYCHLLIEKPLCVSDDGVQELCAEARERGLVVGVGYTYRNHRCLMDAARDIINGKLGRITMAHVRLAYDYPIARPDYRTGYFARHETGGGAIMDIASHAIAYLTWVLGPVEDVKAVTSNKGLGLPVEDTAALTLRFKNGAIATVLASACQKYSQRSFEFVGSDYCNTWAVSEFSRQDEPFEIQAANFFGACYGMETIRTSLSDAMEVHGICRIALEGK